jgi:hypothetical protein
MDNAARYRELATQCEQAASQVSRYDHKAVLLNMAQEWRRLADLAEAEAAGRARTMRSRPRPELLLL